MQTFDIHTGGHDWEKQNLTTQGVKKMYDVYKCRKCGITGKSYRLQFLSKNLILRRCRSVAQSRQTHSSELWLQTVRLLAISLRILHQAASMT